MEEGLRAGICYLEVELRLKRYGLAINQIRINR
jgi:uncharacterized protein